MEKITNDRSEQVMNSKQLNIQWNLDQIIPYATEEKLSSIAETLKEEIQNFSTKYTSFLDGDSLQSNEIFQLLEAIEELFLHVSDFVTYRILAFNANSSLPFNQKAFHLTHDIQTKVDLLFIRYQLKINQAINSDLDILKDPQLLEYKQYLKKEHQQFQHKLAVETEELLIEKDRYGVSALTELRGKWLNNQLFTVSIDGQMQQYSLGKMMGLLYEPNENIRDAVVTSLYTQIERDQEIYSTVFRSICSDWILTSKKRSYQNPMHQSLLAGNVDSQPIETLMQTMEQNVSLYQSYLRLKAKQLNISVLRGSDLFAPPKVESHLSYPWNQSKQLILDTFYSCDQEFGDIAHNMFNSHHIDASPRKGKAESAFCHPWSAGKSAFVLQSYTGKLNDIYTLAHELGHAVHAHLVLRKQKLLNTSTGPIVAEIASKFGELILTDYLLDQFTKKDEKIQALSVILDFNGYSMFWGSLRFWFEKSIYDAIERNIFLDGETINKYYLAAREKIYGDTVNWQEKMKWEWVITPHYYMPNYRFYNYPYIFALIFVYNCFQDYTVDKEEFLPKFKAILEAGGKMFPHEIALELGYDITSPTFWENGLQQYAQFTRSFKSLIE